MSDFTNDDLLSELSSMPSTKKGKKKGGAKKAEPTPTPVEEVKEVNNDDLLDELSSMPTTKKGKKKGGAKKAEPTPVEEPEPVKEKEPEPIKEKEPEPTKEEEGDDDDEKAEEKPGEKKKKKVVKKKKKKEDPFLKMVQEQAKKKRELEERLQKEAEEAERRRQEGEELQRKLDEEQAAEEERIRQEEAERLKELRSMGIKSAAELKALDEKKEQTLNQLNKEGFSNFDDFLDSLTKRPPPKKHKKKVVKEEKKENTEIDVNINTTEAEVVANDNIEEAKPSEELLKHAEKDVVFNITSNNNEEALDDWENFDEEDVKPVVTSQQAETEKNKAAVKEEIKLDTSTTSTSTSTSTTKRKYIEEDPEFIPTKKLRSPVICILGHVDTGKTKILDKLRKTNVQEGEAGGITQQIGATFFPIENFTQHLDKIPEKFRIEPRIPGFLVIDTPGHESFQNLRSRGSSLCDLAILVVDIMHGLEKQTLDSLELLRRRKTPFIIALNKIDRIYQWKSEEWGAFRDSYEVQKKNQIKEFNDRLNRIKMQLVQHNLNTEIYDENPSMKEYVNIVPTSAITGVGMPDMIGMFVYLSQRFLMNKIEYKETVQCTILEVKILEGVGTTIDVILVNGTINVGDKIVIGGLYGPIKTAVKIIITPHPMKEMRVKSEYITHQSMSGAMGIKIFATELENALAGSPLYVYKTEEEADKYAKEISQDFNSVIRDFLSKTGKGIMVQASTLGSLEAILTYLKDKRIEIAAVGLGTLQKKDILKIHTIHSKNENTFKENLTILAFDIKVHPDAKAASEDLGVKVFTADIIYHLFDSYVDYEKKCIQERKKEKEKEAIFPCNITIVAGAVFNRKDPIILGVEVKEGILKIGTPLYVPSKKLLIGTVEGIEINKKATNMVRSKDGSVAIRIKPADTSITVGRHFDEEDQIVSNVIKLYLLIYLFTYLFTCRFREIRLTH